MKDARPQGAAETNPGSMPPGRKSSTEGLWREPHADG
jgi:hypothetical protein